MHSPEFSYTNPFIVAIFKHALFVSAVFWIIGIALVLVFACVLSKKIALFNLSAEGLSEPRARTFLRFIFGAIWLVDGILQFQPAMPLGMASGVVQPMTESTPGWLHALMMDGVGIWNTHPIALAVGTAWLQIGIAILFIVSNGKVSRYAGAVSAAWAGLIWLIGNGAGGIFQSTSSILFGWPGATLFYVIAGVWLCVSNERFTKDFSKLTLRTLSVIAGLGMILQFLPNRGFWHGGNENALTQMAQDMTSIPQPHFVAWFATKVGTLSGTMGGGFNVLIILWLGITSYGLWTAHKKTSQWPVWSLVAGSIFFWFSAQDAPFWGGLATDWNSLIPMAALTWVALPKHETQTPLVRRLPVEMRNLSGAVIASFASAAIIFSIGSVAWASVVSQPESAIFIASNGPAQSINTVAPTFTLTDQHSKSYSLNEHKGHYTLLSFLDPTCWTDCALIANQLQQVGSALPMNSKLDIVAVVTNRFTTDVASVNSFIKERSLDSIKNFYFVTGSNAALESVWNSYGIDVAQKKTDKMSAHMNFVFIIDPAGHLRWVISDEPPSSWAGQHSASSEILRLLHKTGLK
jgi:cytochrome oxidase Cu insertion factor (SCO1/SenC/PrrC family)